MLNYPVLKKWVGEISWSESFGCIHIKYDCIDNISGSKYRIGSESDVWSIQWDI